MFSVTRVRVKLEIRGLGRDLLGITVFLSAQPSELHAGARADRACFRIDCPVFKADPTPPPPGRAAATFAITPEYNPHTRRAYMEIVIPYAPRALQAQLHAEMQLKRWAVVVCHRRFGKTVWAINHILRDALMSSKPNPRYAMMAPTYRQAKSVSWDLLKQYAGSIPGVRFNETELRCDLPNGARISLLGAENGQALRGLELHGVVMDEYANMPESVFPEVIRPALSNSKGPITRRACLI